MTDYHNECDEYPTKWIESLPEKTLDAFILFLRTWKDQCEQDGCHLLKKYALSKLDESKKIKEKKYGVSKHQTTQH